MRVLAFLQAKLVCCPLSGSSELGALLLEFFWTTPESYAHGSLTSTLTGLGLQSGLQGIDRSPVYIHPEYSMMAEE